MQGFLDGTRTRRNKKRGVPNGTWTGNTPRLRRRRAPHFVAAAEAPLCGRAGYRTPRSWRLRRNAPRLRRRGGTPQQGGAVASAGFCCGAAAGRRDLGGGSAAFWRRRAHRRPLPLPAQTGQSGPLPFIVSSMVYSKSFVLFFVLVLNRQLNNHLLVLHCVNFNRPIIMVQSIWLAQSIWLTGLSAKCFGWLYFQPNALAEPKYLAAICTTGSEKTGYR